MAQVKAVVYEEFKKVDGTYNVKIKVYHQKKKRFIDTNHFVSTRQMDEKLQVKDKFVLLALAETLVDYRRAITSLGYKLNHMSCDDLKDFLEGNEEEIDFIRFCTEHSTVVKQAGRDGSARNFVKIRNSLVDFFGTSKVKVSEINSSMLRRYDQWLRQERTMIRANQFGKPVTIKKKGLNDNGVYNQMRDLRTLFNEACRAFNTEDLGIMKIKHYPFKYYKVGAPPKTKKRNIAAEKIIALRDCELPADSRAEQARDLFLLSFYLCGINAVDLFKIDKYDQGWERLEYNRSKTERVRDDDAFISIKIIPEARVLLKKYMGTLQSRYATMNNFNVALSKGMEVLRETCGVPELTFYWARHSFATIARNKCRISKDDIAEALNHVDGDHKTTDIYLEKDWTIVDDVQSAVMTIIRGSNQPLRKLKQVIAPVPNPDDLRKTMRLIA